MFGQFITTELIIAVYAIEGVSFDVTVDEDHRDTPRFENLNFTIRVGNGQNQ